MAVNVSCKLYVECGDIEFRKQWQPVRSRSPLIASTHYTVYTLVSNRAKAYRLIALHIGVDTLRRRYSEGVTCMPL